jgi:hypothetical protein
MAKERIRIKRKGVYGEGFLSEPQSEQYRKIDQVEKKESPELVHEQLSALHSFNSKNPRMRERAEKDLKYSEKTDNEPRRVKKVAELSGNKVDIEAFHPSAYEEDAYAVRTHVVGKPYLDRYTTNEMISAKSPEDAIDKFLAEKHKKGTEGENRLNQENGGDKNMSEKCAPGEEWVEEYNKNDGTHVKGHCRRIHPHLTRADRRQDAKNLEDRRR